MGARRVDTIAPGGAVEDGGGIRLKRLIGTKKVPSLDPFVLLDEFKAPDAAKFAAGLPDHPHRGFDAVNYVVEGHMDVADSHGNLMRVEAGGVQWITAGAGVVHAEMPGSGGGPVHCLQLWVNLPRASKGCVPRVHQVTPDGIPALPTLGGGSVRVIAGTFKDQTGPIVDVPCAPLMVDVDLPKGAGINVPVPTGHRVFAYVLSGQGVYGVAPTTTGEVVGRGHVVVFGPQGRGVKVLAGSKGTRFLLLAGRPLNEPVVRYGPFVLNQRDEIIQAVEDFHGGRLDGSAPVVRRTP